LYRLIDSKTRLGVDEPSCAFVLMAKAPRVGAVKTRLAPLLSAEEAAELSRSFIRDMSANIAGLIGARPDLGVVAFAPAGDEAAFAGLLPNNFTLLAQRGADLGERLLHVAEDLLAAGVGAVCMINSDSPTLPTCLLVETAEVLARPGDQVVLGPADDQAPKEAAIHVLADSLVVIVERPGAKHLSGDVKGVGPSLAGAYLVGATHVAWKTTRCPRLLKKSDRWNRIFTLLTSLGSHTRLCVASAQDAIRHK